MIAGETTESQAARSWKQFLIARLWRYSCLLVVLLAAATLLSGFARIYWIWDLLANLRVQQALVALVLVAICAIYRRWVWLSVPVACFLVHAPWFLPGLERVGGSPDLRQVMKVSVGNVLSSNRNFDLALTEILRDDPDVFVVLEIDSAWAAEIEAATKADYAYQVVHPDDRGNFGMGLYSRYPITHSRIFRLNEGIASIEAVVDVKGASYRVIGTHPLPPTGDRGFRSRNEHLRMLARRVQNPEPEFEGLPTIVLGDFNLTPWSPFFHDFELASGLRRTELSFNVTPTWYVLPLFPLGLSLDHVFISDDLTYWGRSVGGPMGSDHRSVTVTVSRVARGEGDFSD
ncbi:Endonuclease/Exonuclease/phosphatase family protein [Bremerella volcania]|uniref:Endonuclease/Exonuclease/phosphatase family protein n=1 Tax=Bremerella volcania TaxID=2527984 RepID=A0A518CFI3_9BACT|nr:endonuclease/exonuclease/phosphatase family protein [Bremerella volcania]QDU77992.1 Endonuclease/Exonuclease/phosphatase family protein [Bremerella volcania]